MTEDSTSTAAGPPEGFLVGLLLIPGMAETALSAHVPNTER